MQNGDTEEEIMPQSVEQFHNSRAEKREASRTFQQITQPNGATTLAEPSRTISLCLETSAHPGKSIKPLQRATIGSE